MESKVIVITGASSGIGAALAGILGSNGHKLVLAARRKELLDKVSGESGADSIAVETDVTNRNDVERLRDAALNKYGQVDVWINNAGRGTGKTVMELTDPEVDEIISVVLKSVLYGMQTIVPHFQERGRGHLINVSSFLGRVPLATNRSIYSAAKSGVNSLTANLRMDLKSKYPGIKVSLVMPGTVDTEFHKIVKTPYNTTAGARLGQTVVLSAEEVANQIANLIENPIAELFIPSTAADIARSYYQDVETFENRMIQR
jgi:short-subunit dehydrogenase